MFLPTQASKNASRGPVAPPRPRQRRRRLAAHLGTAEQQRLARREADVEETEQPLVLGKQRERLAIEREISAGADTTRAVTLEHARRLLKTLDENIAFEEVEREPASVLGVAASAGTIGSVLSLLLGGLLFAFEGYNSSRQNGWKYGEDGVFSKE